MYDAVSCEGGVWERLAECVEAPVRQLVPLNKSWAALARDDQSALWRVLLRRLPGRRGVHAPCDGDVVRCGEARTWRDAFEGLETLTGGGAVSLLVKAPGWIRLDYGLERPAWFEGVSADLHTTGQAHLLNASISEYDEPYDTKEEPVKTYGHTFRLETQQ